MHDKKLLKQSDIFKIYSIYLPKENKKSEFVSLFNDTLDSVMIAALTDDNKLIFIEQFCPGMGKSNLLFPGGKVDKNESISKAAIREFAEEAKYTPLSLKRLATIEILPKYVYGQTHLFFAKDLKKENRYKGDDLSNIKIKKIEVTKISSMIKKGKITDSRTIALIGLLKDQYYVK